MFLELPPQNPQSFGATRLQLPGGITQLWPESQPLQNLGDPRIFGTVFQDAALFHADVAARLVSQASRLPAAPRAAGGKKVRDEETWNLPGFQLLMLRALYMFCRCHGVLSAHVLDRWANVMLPGDYSTPHAHYDAQSALVYTIDPGDANPSEPMDGSFEIIDPRLPFCCPYQPERPLRGLVPVAAPGMMLLFPAEFLHHVRPFSGTRPRITVAWNLRPGPPPTDRVIDPTKPVPTKTASTFTR